MSWYDDSLDTMKQKYNDDLNKFFSETHESIMAEEKFTWTDELVKDFFIWYSNIYANPNPTDRCLGTFKELNQPKQKLKDREIVHYPNEKYIDTFQIDSVKRLIDNEVFTVGDLIDDGYTTMKVEEIQVQRDSVVLVGNIGNMLLRFAKKAKQPLFKTRDGKDVYEGDNSQIFKINNEFDIISRCAQYVVDSDVYKYFSTGESAKEYVVMNKPCLSYQEVLNVWSERYGYDKLKQLVEQKIEK